MTRPPGTVNRVYSPTQRMEAIALAATIGPLRAGQDLGIPPRTVASWMHKPEASVVIRQAEATIAERLKSAHERALEAVLRALDDPKARLGDKATALRVLGEQRLLAEGRATSHNLNVNLETTPEQHHAAYQERVAAAEFLRSLEAMSDDDLEAFMHTPDGIDALRVIRDQSKETP